jgi:phage baseplate assembly protein gpV
MKKALLFALAMLLLGACGDSTTGPSSSSQATTVHFTLDGLSCDWVHRLATSTGTTGLLTLYIGGATVGTLTPQAGLKSPNYPVIPGSHYVSGKWEALGTGVTWVTWPTVNITVSADQNFNYILECPAEPV